MLSFRAALACVHIHQQADATGSIRLTSRLAGHVARGN
jgi:hypothetical protein